MNDHVSSKHYAVLASSLAQRQYVITMAFIDHQITKKKKSTTSFIVGFFTTRILYKRLTLFKNNSLKIWCFTLLEATIFYEII
jgi:hypothetical protein